MRAFVVAVLILAFAVCFAEAGRRTHARRTHARNTLAFAKEEDTLATNDSLASQHSEASSAYDLLQALIKRLSDQISADTATTKQEIQDRSDSITSYTDAVNSAQSVIDDLSAQLAALQKKIDDAKTTYATKVGEKTSAQKNIDTENASQQQRLGDRITAIQTQIALIKKIAAMLTDSIEGPIPDSIILDNQQETLVQSLIQNTNQAGKTIKKCFLASASGYSSSSYNSACQGKGPLLTIVKSTNGNIFGGFSSGLIDGSSSYKSDSQAFLFSVSRNGVNDLVKLPAYGQNSQTGTYSTYTANGYGPTFGGGHDLHVSDKCNSNTNSYTNLGYSYQPPSGSSYSSSSAQSYLAGSYQFTCADYEVFYFV